MSALIRRPAAAIKRPNGLARPPPANVTSQPACRVTCADGEARSFAGGCFGEPDGLTGTPRAREALLGHFRNDRIRVVSADARLASVHHDQNTPGSRRPDPLSIHLSLTSDHGSLLTTRDP